MKFEKLTRLKNIIKLFINLIKFSKMSTINIKNLLLYVTVFKACNTSRRILVDRIQSFSTWLISVVRSLIYSQTDVENASSNHTNAITRSLSWLRILETLKLSQYIEQVSCVSISSKMQKTIKPLSTIISIFFNNRTCSIFLLLLRPIFY